ncbi:MAG: YciI family protein [Nocardioides sp.]|nr:YciI family protein [Nocardioides sp.]
MRFAVLLKETDPSAWDTASQAQRDAVFEGHAAFDAALRERDALVLGEALDPASTARGVVGGVPVEGPYAETAEHLVGLYVVDLACMQEALDLVGLLSTEYHAEIRPVTVIEGYAG